MSVRAVAWDLISPPAADVDVSALRSELVALRQRAATLAEVSPLAPFAGAQREAIRAIMAVRLRPESVRWEWNS